MIYVTGDLHGDFARIKMFCVENKTSKEDTLIVLGDAGINYSLGKRDRRMKEFISGLPITLFCIYGNHEARPEAIDGYILRDNVYGGQVYVEPGFPRILFAKDGEIYNFNGKEYMVIGGAYSVDKDIRLMRGYHWWPDEQPSEETKRLVESRLNDKKWNIYGVLSHTCPLKYEPIEMFLPGIDQSKVDKTTEDWLDSVENQLSYEHWYCGHYHVDKNIDKMNFRFERIEELK